MHTPRSHEEYDTTNRYTDLTATSQPRRDKGRISIDDSRGFVAPSSHISSISNGKTSKSYQNGSRLDSTQVLTPLLSKIPAHCSQNTENNEISHDNGTDSSKILLDSSSNNNEWKESEKINNIKNVYLHNSHQLASNNNEDHLSGKQQLHVETVDKCRQVKPMQRMYDKNLLKSSDLQNAEFDTEQNKNNLKEPTCGLFGCGPKWARRFASTHIFMVVFLIAYILQGMYMTYFVSVITTIEKLFQIKSKTTGFLLSASEIGQISTAMLLTYFAGRGHRPRWIACGMVLFSIAAFSCALPHFIFGKQLMLANTKLNVIEEKSVANDNLLFGNTKLAAINLDVVNHRLRTQDANLCLPGNNETYTVSDCNEDRKLEQASHSKITFIVLCIFFVSLLSSGIGQTAVTTLGIPYIDDNVASKQSPIYMAITIGVRILGPASGFIVGSFCTRWYVNFTNPGFEANDPRWIGAWWLGPVMIGTLMLLSSIAMFSFPSELRSKNPTESKLNESNSASVVMPAAVEKEEKPKLKDFPKTVRRQLSNDILMFRTASCVLHLLPIAGLYTFLPKYLETQFRMATYDANMIAAFGGILVMGIGIVVSGLIILKLKPTAKSVAAWIALTALFYSVGMFILTFVGCSMTDFAGYLPGTSDSRSVIEPACIASLNCSCDKENFTPVCGIDGKIYTTACHAGCRSSTQRKHDNRTIFTDCSCIPNYNMNNSEPFQAVTGFCNSSCKNFIYFILIFAFCVFMHSTSEVGSMLLIMRCTHPKDKAMAMGFIQSAIGLFGNVPCPIIYGAVVDSACLIWKTVCGKHGACSLYDADTFRRYFLGITAGIMFLAFIMDLVVWSKSHRIDITPEDHIDKKFDKTANDKKEIESNIETVVSDDVHV